MASSSNCSLAESPSAWSLRFGNRTGADLIQILTRLSLALLTAALWSWSLPPQDIGWLAWIALVPLIIACHEVPPLLAATFGFVTGLGTAYGTLHWVFEVPGFGPQHALIAASYLA
ncbi:MAG: hypothetical protein ACXWWE_07525, partial [Nitrospira sp.]